MHYMNIEGLNTKTYIFTYLTCFGRLHKEFIVCSINNHLVMNAFENARLNLTANGTSLVITSKNFNIFRSYNNINRLIFSKSLINTNKIRIKEIYKLVFFS